MEVVAQSVLWHLPALKCTWDEMPAPARAPCMMREGGGSAVWSEMVGWSHTTPAGLPSGCPSGGYGPFSVLLPG